jgi:exonuclease III
MGAILGNGMAIIKVLTKEENDFDSRYLTAFIEAMQKCVRSYYYPRGSKTKTRLSVRKKSEINEHLRNLARVIMKRYLEITGNGFDYRIKREWVL